MPQQHRGVDLGLPAPAGLVPAEEYLDSHAVRVPRATPHLAVATLGQITAYKSHTPGELKIIAICNKVEVYTEVDSGLEKWKDGLFVWCF